MMQDVTRWPVGGILGIMKWPYTPGAKPPISGLASYPNVEKWAASIDWLQGVGRGDVVGVLDLRSGAVVSHVCVARREDYREENGVLWNWEWVVCTADPHGSGLIEMYADASGAILDRRGRHTQKSLVRPACDETEARVVSAEWYRVVAPLLGDAPPVKTWPVEVLPLDEVAFAAECRRIMEDA